MTEKQDTYVNEPWYQDSEFNLARTYPETFINGDPDKFVYMNLNPKGRIGCDDQMFQILRYFRKNLSDREIMDMILSDQIAHANSKIDAAAAGRLIKKNLRFVYVKFQERKPLSSRLDEFPHGIGKIIVRFGNTVELFDTDDRKFYGCHAIQLPTKVSGYWRESE